MNIRNLMTEILSSAIQDKLMEVQADFLNSSTQYAVLAVGGQESRKEDAFQFLQTIADNMDPILSEVGIVLRDDVSKEDKDKDLRSIFDHIWAVMAHMTRASMKVVGVDQDTKDVREIQEAYLNLANNTASILAGAFNLRKPFAKTYSEAVFGAVEKLSPDSRFADLGMEPMDAVFMADSFERIWTEKELQKAEVAKKVRSLGINLDKATGGVRPSNVTEDGSIAYNKDKADRIQ